MNNISKKEKSSEVVISTTLYRALFLLKELYKRALNLQEIKELFMSDKIIGNKISDDTVRMTIMTLKSVGCVFQKPSAKNNFRYELVQSPFVFKLSDEDIELLAMLREQLASNISWDNFLKLNDLYLKLQQTMTNTSKNFKLLPSDVLQNVDLTLLPVLKQACQEKKYINILYSSQKVLKNILIFPCFLKYENGYAYLWGYNTQHQAYSFFRLDRIKKVSKADTTNVLPYNATTNLVLRIKKNIFNFIKSQVNVKILEDKKDLLTIEVEYLSEFHAMQQLLELASNCEVLYPVDFRTKITNKLKEMRDLYK